MSKDRTIEFEQLNHLTKVARIYLTEKELEKFTEQLIVILEAFKQIDNIDTEGVEPSYHPIQIKNVFREDKAKPWVWDPLSNSEHTEDRYFKGPRIV